MKNTVAYIIITVLALSLIVAIPVNVKAEATGYLAIKDYLGKTWSISDVQKIINTTVNTPDGPKSLADYFWIVIDDDPQNKKYNLRDFIVSPLDNVTAVLPLPEGDHYVDIYWFGFHQRQLVNIVNSTHYVLNLETAPTLPLKSYGEPSESAEWSLTSHPDGVKLQRKDGKAYVQFVYNQSYIEVYWYDENTGDNYFSIDVIIDSSYNWKFHLTDPAQTYSDEETGTFFGISYTVAKIYEEVKWEQIGDVLHVTYLVSFGENAYAYEAARHAFDAANTWLNDAYWTWISPAAGTIVAIKSFVETLQGVIDNALAVFKPKNKDYIVIYDVFATPTQIVVTAHAYYKDPDTGNLVAKPIKSANCFTINNRLVWVKQLHGGLDVFINNEVSAPVKSWLIVLPGTQFYSKYENLVSDSAYDYVSVSLPLHKFYISDLSLFDYELWFELYGKTSYTYGIILCFEDADKADVFENNLASNGITYTRSGNTFEIFSTASGLIMSDFSNIEKLIPSQSPGWIRYYVKYVSPGDPTLKETFPKKIKLYYHVVPKIVPPQISLLTDGYYTINNAFAVQVFTDVYRSSNGSYVLSYYILDNEPPPHYLVRDVWYDVESDVAHYVFTVIGVDVYGQDICVEEKLQLDYSVDLKIKRETYNTYMHVKTSEIIFALDSDYTSSYSYEILLTNGTTLTGTVDPGQIVTVNVNAKDVEYAYFKVACVGKIYPQYPLVIPRGTLDDVELFANAFPANQYNHSIQETVRTFEQVTLAMVDYNKLSFLNLAPESIKPLFAPPPYPGYGTPVRDWANIQTTSFDFNATRGDRLFYFDNSTYKWVEVRVYSVSGTQDFEVKRLSDNVTVEVLEVNTISDYYYKWNSSSFSYTGWLYNDNGTLVFVVDSAKWSYTPEEIAAILEKIDIQGLFDQWTQTWNEIAQQLGLIASAIGKGGTSIPWTWLLIGGGLVFILLIIIAASKPGVNVVLSPRGFRYSKVGGR